MLPQISSPRTSSNHAHLEILNRIGLIAINGKILLILLATWYMQIQLPLNWLVTLIGLEIIFQIYSYWRVRQERLVSTFELTLHILFDSLILASVVYFSGGANNPFIYLLLLSIALGTFMLSPKQLIIVSAVQLVLYSVLNIYQRPLELGDASPLNSYHLHLAGMWINFILTVILISVFGLLARHSMLQQEKQIRALREKQLKDEQLLGLGIMSASAAHELGTPLSTMAVVIDDLAHSDMPKEYKEDLKIVNNQIDACRRIIQSLSEKSQLAKQRVQEQSESVTNFKKCLTQTMENWLVYRPQMVLKQNWQPEMDKLDQHLPISVEQAITNLLDNAADASLQNGKDQIEVDCYLAKQQIHVDIRDKGLGISESLQKQLGANPTKSEKKQRLGWGLFLSNASIERVGGQVELSNNLEGGTLTRITLPLADQVEVVA
ncbi:MAG: ATP-binding protein [Kangiellaceae bacterium]|nr:ATP-binding protein [Kangiellaceae bacterium]MCW8999421.1 ATP-binding protein [Kangiellaceae bacterium]